MEKLQDWTAFVFVGATAVLSVTSVLGVWDIFSDTSLLKSFETFGLLAFACVIILAIGAFIEARSTEIQSAAINPIFKSIRKTVVSILVVGVALLALVGVLAIWNVLSGNDILFKSLASLVIIAFAGFVILITCFAREYSLSRHRTEAGSRHPIVMGVVLFFVLFLIVGVIGQLLQFLGPLHG